ncbi:hypothetical protein [Motiliproteus sp. SC1-56]|uniref:tetratricopeptide repeat protein n=1 Tax=Motiliproteus sp. SC1-56 TaxID=2799565 RepID=UPI001A90B5C5|nr:hypothetical protein [Motiliproteus sp. SC1-56]
MSLYQLLRQHVRPALAPLVMLWLGVLSLPAQALDPATTDAMGELQQRWAEIRYQFPEDKREAALEQLAQLAKERHAQYPESPELLIWEGIILSTWAGEKGGLGALKLVGEARDCFEQAIEQDPEALAGSAYTSLGALYYQVPGWPISFGSDKKARSLLEQALNIDPYGIDSNFFYADFLVAQQEYGAARKALERALAAPQRPGRELADQGRRQEIRNLLAQIDDKDT